MRSKRHFYLAVHMYNRRAMLKQNLYLFNNCTLVLRECANARFTQHKKTPEFECTVRVYASIKIPARMHLVRKDGARQSCLAGRQP